MEEHCEDIMEDHDAGVLRILDKFNRDSETAIPEDGNYSSANTTTMNLEVLLAICRLLHDWRVYHLCITFDN